jgi:hypothetical protein
MLPTEQPCRRVLNKDMMEPPRWPREVECHQPQEATLRFEPQIREFLQGKVGLDRNTHVRRQHV